MADPKPYTRGYSFTNYQADVPDQPLPGNRLDVELDNIAEASSELTARVNAGIDVSINNEALEAVAQEITKVVFTADNMDTIRDVAELGPNIEMAAGLYLGAFAYDPSEEADGDPLKIGATYYNTLIGESRVWAGPTSGWVPVAKVSTGGVLQGGTTVAGGATEFMVGDYVSIMLAKNGLVLEPGTDYQMTPPTVIVPSAADGDRLAWFAILKGTQTDAASFVRQTVLATAGKTRYDRNTTGDPLNLTQTNHVLFGGSPFGMLTYGVDYTVVDGELVLDYEPYEGELYHIFSMPRFTNSEAQAILQDFRDGVADELAAAALDVEAAKTTADEAKTTADEAKTTAAEAKQIAEEAKDGGVRVLVMSLYALLTSTEAYNPGDVITVQVGGHAYRVVEANPDLTTAGGVMLRVLPRGDGAYEFTAWNPAVDGTTDDSAKLQAAINRIPASGGTLVMPPGRVRVNSGVYRKLNAAGALGWGLAILGSSEGNTTILIGGDFPAITLDGPDNTFASGVTIKGLRFEAVTPRTGVGLLLRGIVRSDISVYAYRVKIAVECESFLINTLHVRASQCVQGVNFRKEGHYGGAWGKSGCNENYLTGDFGKCEQYALVADTIRGLTTDIHVERCGDKDIASGGVVDTDRGGMKFIDPVGTLRLRGSSEDNGDKEGVNEGKGAILIETSGAVKQPWTVHFDGWNFFGTLDRPEHYIHVSQHAQAGYGVIKFTAVSFSDGPTYVPSASRNKIAIGASAPNLHIVFDGVTMTHASTEMSWNANVKYTIINSPDIAYDSIMHVRHGSGSRHGLYIQGEFENSALLVGAGQKIAFTYDGSRWMRWNSGNNSFELGRGLPGSEVVKHTFPMT